MMPFAVAGAVALWPRVRVTFMPSGSSNTLASQTISAALRLGTNSIIISNPSGAAPDIDSLVVQSTVLSLPYPPQTLSLEMLGGYPLLRLNGATGTNYVLQYDANLSKTNWINLFSITNLPSSPYPVIDYSGFGQPARFYRVLPGQ